MIFFKLKCMVLDVSGLSFIKNICNKYCLKYSLVCVAAFMKNELFRYGSYVNLIKFYQLSNGINGFLVLLFYLLGTKYMTINRS